MLRMLALLILLPVVTPSPAHARIGDNGIIFAAASLKGPLDKAIAIVTATHRCLPPGGKLRVSYGSSGILARQIQHGAPADLFISADERWVQFLAKQGRIDAKTTGRYVLLTNRLVLIGHKTAAAETTSAVVARLKTTRFAMGDPVHVPAGRYVRSALAALGVWDAAKRNAVLAANVRIALSYVARGEVPLGLVYETDAVAEPRVRTIARLPERVHPPIRYVGAVVKRGDGKCAKAWLTALQGEAVQKIFRDAGYGVPKAP